MDNLIIGVTDIIMTGVSASANIISHKTTNSRINKIEGRVDTLSDKVDKIQARQSVTQAITIGGVTVCSIVATVSGALNHVFNKKTRDELMRVEANMMLQKQEICNLKQQLDNHSHKSVVVHKSTIPENIVDIETT